jgi:hypothetical protein
MGIPGGANLYTYLVNPLIAVDILGLATNYGNKVRSIDRDQSGLKPVIRKPELRFLRDPEDPGIRVWEKDQWSDYYRDFRRGLDPKEKAARKTVFENLEGPKKGRRRGRVIPTGDVDPAAQRLAQRIGGQPSVRLVGFGNREFDAVSDTLIAQTTSARSAATNPKAFLSKARRNQIRETLRAAQATGRKVVFEFTTATPAPEVRDFIMRNATRIGLSPSDIRIE